MAVYNENNLTIMGNNHVINGNNCTIAGNNCVVNGNNCVLSGNNCVVNGNNCTVDGNDNIINGKRCVDKRGNSLPVSQSEITFPRNNVSSGNVVVNNELSRNFVVNGIGEMHGGNATMNFSENTCFGSIANYNGYPIDQNLGPYRTMQCKNGSIYVDGEKLVLRDGKWRRL